MTDDFVYAALLLLGIVFGNFYRKMNKDIEQKLWIGTVIGVMTVLFCSGWSSLHVFISFAVCCAIFKLFES
jgi:hypothetical protein